jgi:hypothetical protein
VTRALRKTCLRHPSKTTDGGGVVHGWCTDGARRLSGDRTCSGIGGISERRERAPLWLQ